MMQMKEQNKNNKQNILERRIGCEEGERANSKEHDEDVMGEFEKKIRVRLSKNYANSIVDKLSFRSSYDDGYKRKQEIPEQSTRSKSSRRRRKKKK